MILSSWMRVKNQAPRFSADDPVTHPLREELAPRLAGKSFSFSLIVHCDPQAPLISLPHPSSPVLNVSADCPPDHLVEFLLSEAGVEASGAATNAQLSRFKEEELLEQVNAVGTMALLVKWNQPLIVSLCCCCCRAGSTRPGR